jgi:hypothetical protein
MNKEHWRYGTWQGEAERSEANQISVNFRITNSHMYFYKNDFGPPG